MSASDSMRGHARDALLDAAQTCLARHGYAGTTARLVAAESGANLRSITYHYGSLDELLLTALSKNFRSWMEPLIHAFTEVGDDPHARLERGLALFVSELPEQCGLVSAWLEAVGRSQRE